MSGYFSSRAYTSKRLNCNLDKVNMKYCQFSMPFFYAGNFENTAFSLKH